MRIGNVIQSPGGSKWIVTGFGGAKDEIVYSVAFDAEGVSAAYPMEDKTEQKSCVRCLNDADDRWNEDCEWCHGTGQITVETVGWKHSLVLATNVREFIFAAIKRTWNL